MISEQIINVVIPRAKSLGNKISDHPDNNRADGWMQHPMNRKIFEQMLDINDRARQDHRTYADNAANEQVQQDSLLCRCSNRIGSKIKKRLRPLKSHM